jgi:hypothetical protein
MSSLLSLLQVCRAVWADTSFCLPMQTTIYLYNVHDAGKTTSETPFFCYSHLIMKFNVSPADTTVPMRVPNISGPAELEQNAALPVDLLKV